MGTPGGRERDTAAPLGLGRGGREGGRSDCVCVCLPVRAYLFLFVTA